MTIKSEYTDHPYTYRSETRMASIKAGDLSFQMTQLSPLGFTYKGNLCNHFDFTLSGNNNKELEFFFRTRVIQNDDTNRLYT